MDTEDTIHPDDPLIQQIIEKYAPKLEDSEERPARILLVGDDGMSRAVSVRLRELAFERGIDIVIPPQTLEEPEREGRRVVVSASASMRLNSSALAALLGKAIAAQSYAEKIEECYAPDITEPLVMEYETPKQKTNFRQFEKNQRKYGPPNRRQFAMCRPPRRGGR